MSSATRFVVSALTKCISPFSTKSENGIQEGINSIFAEVKKVFMQNIKPALLIVFMEILLVVLYYFNPTVNSILVFMSDLKIQLSYLYSFLSTGLFMGIIPWCVAVLKGSIKPSNIKKSGIYLFICYGFVGVQSDLFYQLQSYLFGNEGVLAIIAKMFVDQFVWTLFYMSHINYWINWIYNNGVKLPQCSSNLFKQYISHDWIIGLLGGYIIWIPSCITIYSMAPPLQLIMMNLIGVFFVIVMATITKKPQEVECTTELIDEESVVIDGDNKN